MKHGERERVGFFSYLKNKPSLIHTVCNRTRFLSRSEPSLAFLCGVVHHQEDAELLEKLTRAHETVRRHYICLCRFVYVWLRAPNHLLSFFFNSLSRTSFFLYAPVHTPFPPHPSFFLLLLFVSLISLSLSVFKEVDLYMYHERGEEGR